VTIRTRQVAGVTALVAVVVIAVSAVHVVTVARLHLTDTEGRGELLANAMFQAASKVVPDSEDPYAALRADHGVRTVLESSVGYANGVTDAAIVDTQNVVVAHCFPSLEGRTQAPRELLTDLDAQSLWAQLAAIYSDRLFEIRQPLLLGQHEFGTVRIGVSTLLIQEGLRQAMQQAAWTALLSFLVAVFVAVALAGWMLRPIHVISSGLTRLGRGEFNVRLELPPGDEFRLLGTSFEEVSAQLLAARGRASAPDREEAPSARIDGGTISAIERASEAPQAIAYSRKLASFGRLLAGVAHEVKNPLNAMTIHLELLRQKLQDAQGDTGLTRHVTIIGGEIKRLDQVLADLIKFVRPEELQLQPLQAGDVIADVVRVIEPEARRASVTIRTDAGHNLPDITADSGMLQQALVNLALNACQAMPNGGTLEFRCRPVAGRRVEVAVSDTGVGIAPEHLQRIFDLYFTTKEGGSGIGLSLVYRIVQLHDGEITVESTPGRGTTFRLLLPQT
jgi:signal transduction histidine kinase